MIEWRTIQDYPSYEVSNTGEVRLRRYTKLYDDGTKEVVLPVLVKKYHQNGYEYVNISGSPHSVHRLVAKAFLSNPNNYSIVRHKDGNKSNNCVENLTWQSNRYDRKSVVSTHIELFTTSAGKRVKCLENGKIFISIKAAAMYYNIPYDRLVYSVHSGRTIRDLTFVITSDSPNTSVNEL